MIQSNRKKLSNKQIPVICDLGSSVKLVPSSWKATSSLPACGFLEQKLYENYFSTKKEKKLSFYFFLSKYFFFFEKMPQKTLFPFFLLGDFDFERHLRKFSISSFALI